MTQRDQGSRQPPLPKPYDFVPLSDNIVRQHPIGHHRYARDRISGTLEAVINALSPIHVASGLLEPQPNNKTYPIVKAHFRSNGVPTIPGSSLKGCIRSIVEAITGSAVTITRAYELAERYRPYRTITQLDIAQRLFGAQGYLGAVSIADAPLLKGTMTIIPAPQLFRPRPEAFDTYFDGKRPRGRKFYMHGKLASGNLPLEACAVDSQFRLRLTFNNLLPAELGVIVIALGLGNPAFCPKLGGGKPACLGSIKISQPVLSCDFPQSRYTGSETTSPVPDVATLATNALQAGFVHKAQLDRLATILRYPRDDRSCPDRSY